MGPSCIESGGDEMKFKGPWHTAKEVGQGSCIVWNPCVIEEREEDDNDTLLEQQRRRERLINRT